MNFDPRKDYSKEIEKARREGRDTTQLETERQAKIDAKYDGNEPAMWGSNKTYSAASKQGDSKTISAAMGESQRVHRNDGRKVYAPGASKPAVKNTDMVGGAGYKNKRVGMGDWTYIFNENGKQVGKIHDGGASATDSVAVHPGMVHKSEAHLNAYNAANSGDWDAVGEYLNQIGQADGGDMAAANEYAAMLQMAHPGGVEDFYKRKYDAANGEGTWEDPNHFRPTDTVAGTPGAPGMAPAAPTTMEEYIRQMYQRKADAEQAALQAAYDSSRSKLEGYGERISDIYDAERARAAGQNDVERMRMNELGIAQGLNTGATGQLALGQSMAYQGAMGDIAQQEAAKQAENERALADLLAQFESQKAQAQANTDSGLYEALIQEALRQEGIKQQEAEMAAQAEADRQEAALRMAEKMAAYGDFSGYAALGYDTAAMQSGWNRLHPAKTSRSGGSGSGSGSGGEKKLTFNQVDELLQNGVTSDKLLDLYYQYTGANFDGGDTPPAGPTTTFGPTANSKPTKSAAFGVKSFDPLAGMSNADYLRMVQEGNANGKISDAEAMQMLISQGLI